MINKTNLFSGDTNSPYPEQIIQLKIELGKILSQTSRKDNILKMKCYLAELNKEI